jgi:hypothetical protein
MARAWKSRPAPPKTSITEIARRYHAAAVALAQTLGLSLQEVLSQHRESVTAIFIECGRCDLRLPAGVSLPPLGRTAPAAPTNGQAPDVSTTGDAALAQQDRHPADPSANGAVPVNGTTVPSPTTIPTDAGLPCGGVGIPKLTPAQLHMLLAKVDQLAAEKGSAWRPLLTALVEERQARLARGQRPKPPLVAGDGHGG